MVAAPTADHQPWPARLSASAQTVGVTHGQKPNLPAPFVTKSAANAPDTIQPPAGFLPTVPAGDGSVEIDTSGLEGLKPVVARHIDAITAQIDSHLRNLQNTDWQGQAKETAVTAVSGFSNAAKNLASDARTSITSYIDKQINLVLAGDR